MKDYRIVLHAYFPQDAEEKKNGIIHKHSKGEYIGGVMRLKACADLEAAIEEARQVWKENHVGCMKQVRIFAYDWGTPGQVLFTGDNFNEMLNPTKVTV
jgi:hypothetical protein